MVNTAIIGLSGDPVTKAHIQVVEEVHKLTHITQFILSPSGERADKKQKIEIFHRKEITKIFQKILQNMGIDAQLDTHFLEGNNGGHTTTAQEESYFKDELGFSPYFVYGTDVVPQMPTWSGNKDKFIEKKLNKIIIPRPGYSYEPEKHGLENFILLDVPCMLDISSSMAREMIANKQDVSDILPAEVIEYIEKNNLYQ